jgi:hypothetical protein
MVSCVGVQANAYVVEELEKATFPYRSEAKYD